LHEKLEYMEYFDLNEEFYDFKTGISSGSNTDVLAKTNELTRFD
jgi:hypothetical protein